MTTSATKLSQDAVAIAVTVTSDTLTVDLSDGRSLSVPLTWFPRLVQGTLKERQSWQIIGKGRGIHWNLLDEDISVAGLIGGHPSGESQASFKRWLDSRK